MVYVSLVKARATRNCEDVGGCAKSETLGSNRGVKRGKREAAGKRGGGTPEAREKPRSFGNDSRAADEQMKRWCRHGEDVGLRLIKPP